MVAHCGYPDGTGVVSDTYLEAPCRTLGMLAVAAAMAGEPPPGQRADW